MVQALLTKLTFNIPTCEVEALKALAASQGITVTSAIRKAIGMELFLAEQEKAGAKVLLEEYNGQISRVIRK